MANGVDPDETAHYEPSHLDLHCLPSGSTVVYSSTGLKRLMHSILRRHFEILFSGTISVIPVYSVFLYFSLRHK